MIGTISMPSPGRPLSKGGGLTLLLRLTTPLIRVHVACLIIIVLFAIRPSFLEAKPSGPNAINNFTETLDARYQRIKESPADFGRAYFTNRLIHFVVSVGASQSDLRLVEIERAFGVVLPREILPAYGVVKAPIFSYQNNNLPKSPFIEFVDYPIRPEFVFAYTRDPQGFAVGTDTLTDELCYSATDIEHALLSRGWTHMTHNRTANGPINDSFLNGKHSVSITFKYDCLIGLYLN